MSENTQPEKLAMVVPVRIEPGNLILVGVLAGFLFGALMVLLDPWLRFPQIDVRINWRDMLLTASIFCLYGFVLGWTLTTFWGNRLAWLIAALTTPIITLVIGAWNRNSGALGVESDILFFLPVVLVFHLAALGLAIIYLSLVLRSRWRRPLAFGVLPLVLGIIIFLGVARLRWENPDATDVMRATDQYAMGVIDDDYAIEFLTLTYNGEIVPTGNTRIHTDGMTWYCRVRLFQNNAEVTCRTEE
ncbi:MAG: hypothetical protein ACLFTK_15270 [Anaerolineales bacterium]